MKTYTDKTRYLFTQLRARGISLGAISAELDVPKSTLGDWDKQLADEIGRLRAIEWEAVEEQFGRTLEQDLRAMAQRIRKWEARIDRMNPDQFKVREVLAVLRETRREYFRRRAILMAPLERTLTRAVTRGLDINRHPDESGRSPFSSDTPPRNTNDLQQSPSSPSGSGARPSPVAATLDQPQAIAESCDAQTDKKIQTAFPSPGGCGTESSAHRNNSTRQGEGDPAASVDVQINGETPTTLPSCGGARPSPVAALTAESNAICEENPAEAESLEQTNPSQQVTNPGPDPASPGLCVETPPGSEINDDLFLGSVVVNPHECNTAVVLKTLEQEAAHRARLAAADPNVGGHGSNGMEASASSLPFQRPESCNLPTAAVPRENSCRICPDAVIL